MSRLSTTIRSRLPPPSLIPAPPIGHPATVLDVLAAAHALSSASGPSRAADGTGGVAQLAKHFRRNRPSVPAPRWLRCADAAGEALFTADPMVIEDSRRPEPTHVERSAAPTPPPRSPGPPLFSHLGRLDLARLAGELEERHFTPGEVIVRQGDRPDGFYVIKQGRATVLVGGAPAPVSGAPEPAPTSPATAPASLLTRSGRVRSSGKWPSSPTRRAARPSSPRPTLTVWRLSRARFDTLLTHERAIARAIERSLSHRLAAMSQERGGAARACGRVGSPAAALGALSPMARALMPALLARRAGRRRSLRRACARTGDDGGARRAVRSSRGSCARTGLICWSTRPSAPLAGNHTEGAVSADAGLARGRRRGAGRGGRPRGGGGPRVRMRGRSRPPEHGGSAPTTTRLLEACSAGDLERWIAQAGPARSRTGRSSGRPASHGSERMALAEGAPGSRERAGAAPRALAAPARHRPLPGAACGACRLRAGCLMPLPPGLGRGGAGHPRGHRRHRAPAHLRRPAGLRRDAAPELTLVVPGLVPATDVLAGFATPAWIMIVALLALGTAVSRSGLMFRLVLLSLQRLPPRFLNQSLVLCGTGVLLSAGLPSGSTRIALGVPIGAGSPTPWASPRGAPARPRSGSSLLHLPPDGRAVP